MSGKTAKAARRSAREPAPPITPDRPTGFGFWTSWKGGLVVVGIIAVIPASFVLPGAFKEGNPSEASHATAMGIGAGTGLPVGSPVPTFSAKDLNGTTISNKTVYGHKTLLFFSEGVICQACFQQFRGCSRSATSSTGAGFDWSRSRRTRPASSSRPRPRTTSSHR
jgi:hypothetical protein